MASTKFTKKKSRLMKLINRIDGKECTAKDRLNSFFCLTPLRKSFFTPSYSIMSPLRAFAAKQDIPAISIGLV